MYCIVVCGCVLLYFTALLFHAYVLLYFHADSCCGMLHCCCVCSCILHLLWHVALHGVVYFPACVLQVVVVAWVQTLQLGGYPESGFTCCTALVVACCTGVCISLRVCVADGCCGMGPDSPTGWVS